MQISVIGTGHGGCAAASVFALRKHEVTLCKLGSKLHNDNFEAILKNGGIELQGIEGASFSRLTSITRDPAEAIHSADIIFVFYVSNFHQLVAEALAPHFRSNQIVVIGPGYAGSLLFSHAIEKSGNKSNVLLVELETLPYSSRIVLPGKVNISSKNVRHPLAALPSSSNQEAVDSLNPILGNCIARTNVLEIALHNPNLSIHTVGTLMNVARIENDGDHFHMYKDGFSPAIWKMVGMLDKEKMHVLEQIGAKPRSYFEEFVFRTFDDLSIDPMDGFMRYANEAPSGPNSIWTRYITEDVPIGLGLLSSLGKHLSVPTPVAESLIHLASLLHGEDYYDKSRSLQNIWPGKIDDLICRL